MTSESNRTTSDSECFDELSSFNSENSFVPKEFTGNGVANGAGHMSYDDGHVIDVSKTKSGTSETCTIKASTSNDIERIVTKNALENNVETTESLKRAVSRLSKTGANNVLSVSQENNSVFPDGYRIETTTGLVPVKTIEEMRKTRSAVSGAPEAPETAKKNANGYLHEDKIILQVERNRHEIEQYEKHKHETNFVKKLFYKIFD